MRSRYPPSELFKPGVRKDRGGTFMQQAQKVKHQQNRGYRYMGFVCVVGAGSSCTVGIPNNEVAEMQMRWWTNASVNIRTTGKGREMRKYHFGGTCMHGLERCALPNPKPTCTSAPGKTNVTGCQGQQLAAVVEKEWHHWWWQEWRTSFWTLDSVRSAQGGEECAKEAQSVWVRAVTRGAKHRAREAYRFALHEAQIPPILEHHEKRHFGNRIPAF